MNNCDFLSFSLQKGRARSRPTSQAQWNEFAKKYIKAGNRQRLSLNSLGLRKLILVLEDGKCQASIFYSRTREEETSLPRDKKNYFARVLHTDIARPDRRGRTKDNSNSVHREEAKFSKTNEASIQTHFLMMYYILLNENQSYGRCV